MRTPIANLPTAVAWPERSSPKLVARQSTVKAKPPTAWALILLLFVAFNVSSSTVHASGADVSSGAKEKSVPAPHPAAIPFDQIGAVAGKQYSGDGLTVAPCPDGAKLRCVFQRLNGHVTPQGLWLVSTKAGATGEPFRVIARALGRDKAKPLALTGKVAVDGKVARFIRPELTEEYSVGIDGVQQDFVIEHRPPGKGPLRLVLEVDGAKAEAMVGGARLVLADDGRQMVYNRVKAVDASGREFSAKVKVVSNEQLAVVLHDACAKYPVRIDPTFSDANWISMGGWQGANSTINAAVVDNSGNLYVGGGFTIIGNTQANGIAKWNGSSWSALGLGINGVNALALSGTNLYAGGAFTIAGGVAATNIARWNGSSWSALGMGSSSGYPSKVNALAVSGTNLYVGGDFEFISAEHIGIYTIARWNGSSWSPLGVGLSGAFDSIGDVYALAVSGNTLYVGGVFTTAYNSDGTAINVTNIAQWNGSSWSPLGSGVDSGLGVYAQPVYALAVSGNTLYAGGGFTTAGGVAANNVAQWNGSSWAPLASGMDNNVYALAVSGGTLYAGGYFTTAGGVTANGIAQWNGSSWSSLGSDVNGNGFVVYALAVQRNKLPLGGDTLYVGGTFTAAGGVVANNIAEWNGAKLFDPWSPLGLGWNGWANALAVSGNTLYAGGNFTSAGGAAANNVAQWNGSSWSGLGSGMNGVVNALAVSGSTLYAGGNFTSAGGAAASNVAQWNGSSWSGLGSGMNGVVNALAVSGSTLYAGGYFTTAGGVLVNSIAQWDGSSWSPLGSGINRYVYALAVSGNTLYAGGDITRAGGIVANGIARWNGSSWSPLGSGVNGGGVSALAVSGNTLYAGGYFTIAGGVLVNSIAQWDGNTWSPLGSGVSNGDNGTDVNALAVSGGTLCVGGDFTTAGGIPANYIAQWNGRSWSALGSGMNRVVNAVAVSGYTLYAGGEFAIAGTNVSPSAAMANLPPTIQYTANPTTGLAPFSVQFSSPDVDFSGIPIASWNWNFGDGSSSRAQNPSHTYVAGGTFAPTLVASNDNGVAIQGLGPIITVKLPIEFTASPTNGAIPLTVQFSSPNVDSSGTSITNWEWDFGDGLTNAIQNPSHTYVIGGIFSPTFTGTDTNGIPVQGIGPVIRIQPQIQPTNQIAISGQSPQFTVTADGSNPLYYQWYFDGAPITGASGATLQLQNATTNQTGYYTVVVMNTFGSVTSNPVHLGVYDYPAITSQIPQSGQINTVRGQTETLSVIATGTALQYQWFDSSGLLTGATNSSLALSINSLAMNGIKYWVVVSNAVGSVTSGSTLLYVDLALRHLPTGYWQGIGYWPNIPMTYTIQAGPPVGTIDYAVQDQLSVYPDNSDTNGLATNMIIGAISDGGTFDANNYIIKWGPFFDDSPRTFTYVLTAPSGTTNWAQFSGIISIDGTNYPVQGTNEINLLPLHPADNGGQNSQSIDNQITINEMTAYAAAWKLGGFWPVEPNPIPISYVTSAGFIWKKGEYYAYQPTLGAPPACWVNTNPPSAMLQPAFVSKASTTTAGGSGQIQPMNDSASTAVCSMATVYTNGAPFTVTLTVTPASSVNVYAVEDQIPAGWTATNFSAGGAFDNINNEVKWGPFFDNSTRTLSYQVLPGNASTGTATFSGTASFDGLGIAITGVRQVFSSAAPPPAFQRAFMSQAGLVLTWNTVSNLAYQLQFSTNLASTNWLNMGSPLTATNNTLSLTNTIGPDPQGFYRVLLLP